MARLSYPGTRRPTPRKDAAPGFTTEATERAWRAEPPERGEASSATIEALIYPLRSRGIMALADEDALRRLSELSPRQMKEIIQRLQKMRANYPAISDSLISFLSERLK